MKEKIDKEFLKQTDEELKKSNVEWKRYSFRLSLIGGTKEEKYQTIKEFENQMLKVEIRKGNVDCRIEMLIKIEETLKPKPHMSKKEIFKLAEKMDTISEKTKTTVIFTRSGSSWLDE